MQSQHVSRSLADHLIEVYYRTLDEMVVLLRRAADPPVRVAPAPIVVRKQDRRG